MIQNEEEWSRTLTQLPLNIENDLSTVLKKKLILEMLKCKCIKGSNFKIKTHHNPFLTLKDFKNSSLDGSWSSYKWRYAKNVPHQKKVCAGICIFQEKFVTQQCLEFSSWCGLQFSSILNWSSFRAEALEPCFFFVVHTVKVSRMGQFYKDLEARS